MIPDVPEWAEDIPDFERWHEEEWKWLIEKLKHPSVIIIRGTGRSGKTALSYFLLSKAKHMNQETYIKGGKPEQVDWLEQIDSISELQEKGEKKKTLLIDDIGALGLTARNSQKKEAKALQEFGTVISHKRITVLISIQNLALLDVKGLMTTQDCVVLHKLSNSFGIELERGWAKKRILHANSYLYYLLEEFYEVPQYDSDRHEGKGLFFDINTNRVAYNPLPDYFTDDISRSYKNEAVA